MRGQAQRDISLECAAASAAHLQGYLEFIISEDGFSGRTTFALRCCAAVARGLAAVLRWLR